MRPIFFFFVILLTLTTQSQSLFSHGRLKATPDGHYLQFTDGTPFFWLGDTGWELFHRLTLPEIKQYLENRAAKGFNVVQAVALADVDGLHKPNPYGEVPFKDLATLQPNEKYFRVIDSTVHMARSLNLFVGLLPTWGDKVTQMWGIGPVIFDSAKAYVFGKWIGNRYKAEPNIIWVLGGDRPPVRDSNDWRPVWRGMARGIIEATGGQALITYHPWGSSSSSQWLHNETWLHLNSFQSGHGEGHDTPCWEMTTKDVNLKPTKPTLDMEPNYEDHPVNSWPKWNPESGYFRDYDVRKQCYRSVFAGACGVTYGHHALWQFMSAKEEALNYPDRGWINAMDRPGAFQVGYLRRLMESRPVLDRVPDNSIIGQGQGEKGDHMEAFRAADYSYAMVYLPVGKTISVNLGKMAKGLAAWWFNPRDASAQKITLGARKDAMEFSPPTTGVGNDWVLVIDEVAKEYKVGFR